MSLTDRDAREELAVAVYGQDAPVCELSEGVTEGPSCPEPATHRALFNCGHHNNACTRHAQQLRDASHEGFWCLTGKLHVAWLVRVIPI